MKNWLEQQTCDPIDSQSWRRRWEGECCDSDGLRRRRMFRGDTLVFLVQVLKPAPGSVGDCPALVPVDLTGYTVRFTAKYYLPDNDRQAVVQLTNAIGGGIVVTSALAGMATLTVPPSATRFFPDGIVRIVYDVQVVDAGGIVSTVEIGIIQVIPNVTRTPA